MSLVTECVHAKSLQSCLTLCNPMDYSPPGSSVHGISQVRILEGVAISSSRGSCQPRDQTLVSCLLRWQVGSFPLVASGTHVTQCEHNFLLNVHAEYFTMKIRFAFRTLERDLNTEPCLSVISFFKTSFYFIGFTAWLLGFTRVPQSGIEPTLPAVETPGPNSWTSREVPCCNSLNVNRLHLSQMSDSNPWEREKQVEGRREWASGPWNRWTPSHSRSPCSGGGGAEGGRSPHLQEKP